MRRKEAPRKASSEQEEERLIIRYLLSTIFADAAANGREITPDDAVRELRHQLSELIAKVGDAPNWQAAAEAGLDIFPEKELRWAHHEAVDMYYDARFGCEQRTGAPRHSALHLLSLAASMWGKSYKEIADELGLPITSLDDRLVSIDRVSKQARAARERFPHLTPATKRKKGR